MTVYFASLVIPLAVLMPNALFVLLLPTRTPLKPPPVAGQTGQAQAVVPKSVRYSPSIFSNRMQSKPSMTARPISRNPFLR